jgi:TatD DNase family protein
VGEIGLDHYWDTSFAPQQEEAFRLQIEWSIQYQLPIVIHTRNAMQETINIVKEYVPRGVRGIFHCFGGSHESAIEIIKAGFYLGIGGVLTYKKAGLPEVLEKIDLQHMVLETDAPYLTPVPFRGKRNESSYLSYVVDKLAEIKNVSAAEVAAITTANAEKIFGA